MINLNNKKIGIWGLGVVGKSVVEYLHSQNHNLTVMDRKPLTPEEDSFLGAKNISYILQNNPQEFLEIHDYIIASPGIDLRAYTAYSHKFISELDLFSDAWHKPIIAITGTVGKTSITHLLSTILNNNNKRVITGGNIGTALLSLINQQDNYDYAVIELSSFQLEQCTRFAPDLAIWTNLYPNHLDRHETVANYFTAKYAILAHQNSNQKALLPLELAQKIRALPATANRPLAFFCLTKPEVLTPDMYYYCDGDTIVRQSHNTREIIATQVPEISYPINWLIIYAALDLLGISIDARALSSNTIPDHRLDLVATINSIDFYNDSKSTIMEATLAAVKKLSTQSPNKSITLLLGGLSKGVNRAPYIKQLTGTVSKIVCFGTEADSLYNFCTQAAIPAKSYATLEQAFAESIAEKSHDMCILFSPGGSSYDLFADYKQRGERFKQLVQDYN